MSGWVDKFLEQLDLAGVILLFGLVLAVILFMCAQRGKEKGADFDFRRMLTDDADKPSMLRILAVGAFFVSSWVLMRDAISINGADSTVLAIYLASWSGAPVVAKLIEALESK